MWQTESLHLQVTLLRILAPMVTLKSPSLLQEVLRIFQCVFPSFVEITLSACTVIHRYHIGRKLMNNQFERRIGGHNNTDGTVNIKLVIELSPSYSLEKQELTGFVNHISHYHKFKFKS